MRETIFKRTTAAAVVFAAVFAAGWASPQRESSTGEPQGGQPITLRMAWWGGQSRNEATLEAIELYMSQNPNVTIEAEYGGFDGFFEKLITQLSAGTAPDVMQTDYQWFDQFFRQIDLFVDFNRTPEMDLSQFDPTFLESFTSPDGKLIGAPTGINGTTMYMNATLADRLGIDYTRQMTWDRLLTEGTELHRRNPQVYMLNMTINQDLRTMLFEPYLFTLTGKRFIENDGTLGFDRQSLIQTFEYVLSLYDNGVMQPVAETASIRTGQLAENPKWLNNEVVFLIDLTSRYIPITGSISGSEVIAVEFPSPKDAVNSGILLRPTNLYSVYARSGNVNEAVRFTSWILNDPEAARIQGLERSMPASGSAREALVAEGVVSENFNFSVNYAIEHAGLPQSFISLNQEIQAIEDDVLTRVVYRDWSPERGADEMIRQITNKLAELGSR